MASTDSRSLSFETAIGEFVVTALVMSNGSRRPKVVLEEREPKPPLPEGMRVQRCRAALLSVQNAEPMSRLSRIDFKIALSSGVSGDPCTGQGLDAQEWSKDGNLVVVGTEDGEWLNARLPILRCEDLAVVKYSPTSLALELENLPVCKNLSFHFVIAENPDPEPVDCSTWFAVDCPHQVIQSA